MIHDFIRLLYFTSIDVLAINSIHKRYIISVSYLYLLCSIHNKGVSLRVKAIISAVDMRKIVLVIRYLYTNCNVCMVARDIDLCIRHLYFYQVCFEMNSSRKQ